MKSIVWSIDKNAWLKQKRGISFDEIQDALEKKQFLAKIPHPNVQRYPNQEIFILLIKKYVYCVPFVEDDEKIFLKTIYPSRSYMKRYNKKEER